MQAVEAQLKKFPRGATLATRMETVSVIFWQKDMVGFCLCLKNSSEAKFKSNELVFFDRGDAKMA